MKRGAIALLAILGLAAVAMEAYDTLGVVAAAVKQAGSDDRAALLKALETLDYQGVNGTYRFSTEQQPKWAYHQWMDVPFMNYPVHQREPGARRCGDRLSEGMGDGRQDRSVSWRR